VVEGELQAFDPRLLQRPRVIAANKIDLPHGPHLAALSALCAERTIPLFPISALTGEGVETLVRYLATQLQTSSKFRVPGARCQPGGPAGPNPEPGTRNLELRSGQQSTGNSKPSAIS
jgi:GTP-binding protein